MSDAPLERMINGYNLFKTRVRYISSANTISRQDHYVSFFLFPLPPLNSKVAYGRYLAGRDAAWDHSRKVDHTI